MRFRKLEMVLEATSPVPPTVTALSKSYTDWHIALVKEAVSQNKLWEKTSGGLYVPRLTRGIAALWLGLLKRTLTGYIAIDPTKLDPDEFPVIGGGTGYDYRPQLQRDLALLSAFANSATDIVQNIPLPLPDSITEPNFDSELDFESASKFWDLSRGFCIDLDSVATRLKTHPQAVTIGEAFEKAANDTLPKIGNLMGKLAGEIAAATGKILASVATGLFQGFFGSLSGATKLFLLIGGGTLVYVYAIQPAMMRSQMRRRGY